MKETTLHRRNFLLHLQKRAGYERPVLIKEPASELPLPSHIAQLHNEYAITKRLADVPGVRPALAMEGPESQPVLHLGYIPGHSLAELIRSTLLDLAEKLRLALNVATILSHIHDHQVMHKNINSSNILVASDDKPGSQGGVYIIDFGIASTMWQESPSQLATDATLAGTLAYVSPEQTGRMNRHVDYRTDFYSLGVTLYELFTGQLPFESGDALRMIHDHIARSPEPPHQIDARIPCPLSDIILKLLAKNAQDRYQTAYGLQADLKTCLEQWQSQGQIEAFELGGDDFTGRVQPPEKLYGRQAEVERLKTILNHTIMGQVQLLLVAGYSGVGKTSLVHEIQSDVIAKGGIFVEGKFDQLQQTLPYSAWEQAFTQLVNIWLAESEINLVSWRETILDALGDYGQILIDIIPALELIIGPQPAIPQVGGIENQNRLNYYFNRFISSLTTPEHPLVVFLDDVQWIDLASLNLIEALLAEQSTSPLLVIGAYRDNEVGADHPLVASQDRMRGESDWVTVITLGDLAPDDINHLLADSLQPTVADCPTLSQILFEKTAGNPFYFRQLLYVLESGGLLRFDRERRRWVWEEARLQSLQARGSVVDLMIGKLQRLPVGAQRTLSMAACLGNRFDIATLGTITGQPQLAVLTALSPAMKGGLIVQSNGLFSFTHDRIQEAVYALIPKSDLPQTHLEIGRLLLAGTAAEHLEEEIFAVVGHLNAGRALIDTDSEKTDLAALNLAAGQRAKAASAYSDAKEYVEIGLDLLGPNSWQEHYELTLSLHNAVGELAALNGQYEQIAPIADLVHANARSILDQARIFMTRIEAETMQYNFPKALEIGLNVLRDLGIEIPARPTAEDAQRLHDKLVRLLTGGPAERVAELPEMSDQRALAASFILASEMSTSYIVDPPLYPIISYQGAILTLESGSNVWSPFFFAGLGLVAASSVDRETPFDEALDSLLFSKRMQEIALEMRKSPTTTRSRTKVLQILGQILPWTEPIEDAIKTAQDTFQSGIETGDLLYGSYGTGHFSVQGLAAGMNLDEYQRQLSDYMHILERMDQKAAIQWISIFLQTAQNFKETSPAPHKLTGIYFDEDVWLPGAVAAGDIPGRHFVSLSRLLLSYHFDVDAQLDEYVSEAEAFLAGGAGMVSFGLFHCYYALAKLRLCPDLTQEDKTETMDLVDSSLRLMKVWSKSAPSTFRHKYDLIAAEKARVSGDTDGALSHYEGAIQGARDNSFTHEEALANELYARFWLERDNDRFASVLMGEAYDLYRKWGALTKAEHLESRYPKLFTKPGVVVDESQSGSIIDPTGGDFDLLTILKASQEIASEIELNSLLAKLMTNVIENSGAQQGYLILEQDGQWMIVAQADVDEAEPQVVKAKNIAENDLLAQSIVHYVARTQETVVLDDASCSGEFVQDPYVRSHQVKSLLCAPLINQGKTSGIIYLENNLAPHVFSTQRVNLLKLLSSQMAISIDNARVHNHLERLLEERSKALASAESQVRSLFENSPLGIALSSIDGQLLAVNRAVLQMLLVTEEEVLQRNVTEFYRDPSDRNALLNGVQESGFVQDFGVQLLRNDGSSFFASLNVSRLVLEGNDVLLAMVEDVTDQITAEQESAILEERARLARELHDAVTQTLFSASLLADTTPRIWEKDQAIARQNLIQVGRLLRGALAEMRTLLLELRPAEIQNQTLGQLLGPLAEAARARTRGTVNLQIEGDRTLPEDVTVALHRIAQESLNNVVKHAEATTVDVNLICGPESVVLRITDDGRGFDVEKIPAGHHGLSIMRERAQEIGGTFEFESNPGDGTQVVVTWPEPVGENGNA